MNKNLMLSVLAILLTLSIAEAKTKGKVVTITPEKPRIGDQITVIYHANAKNAQLKDVDTIDLYAFVMKREGLPVLIETPMKKEDNDWIATFKLDDPEARMILIKFVSGERVDDNGELLWDVLVYGDNGNPIKDAHRVRAQSFVSSAADFKRTRDMVQAKKELKAELKLYPDNWRAKTQEWAIELREKKESDKIKAKIEQEVNKLYVENKDNEEVLKSLIYWFNTVGDSVKAEEIKDKLLTKDPKGEFAQSQRFVEILKEQDEVKRVELTEKFLADFPDSKHSDNLRMMLARYYLKKKDFDKAEAIANALSSPNGSLYNSIAWTLVEKDTLLKRAVELAKKGIDLLRNPDPTSKPPYMPKKRFERMNRNSLGYILDTYAFALFKLGHATEAEKAYEEAFDLTEGANPDINERLVQCYVKNGNYDKAIEVSLRCVRMGMASDELVEYFREAYTKKYGTEEGFDQMLSGARDEAKVKLREKIMVERINKRAPNFKLKDLNGNVVQLANLKGKVVVVDFWATWCGPCRASFPYLQKVCKKYKDNDDVRIYAINTWERESGVEREDKVKKFIKENGYTFTVLLDIDNKVVEKYGVEGIPTKFVIDKKGKIQFEGVGFHGPEMVDELSMQIELLLSED